MKKLFSKKASIFIFIIIMFFFGTDYGHGDHQGFLY